MSFTKLSKDELLEAAEFFGVDLDGNESKAEIVAAFAEQEPPITFSDYQQYLTPNKESAIAPVATKETVPVITDETPAPADNLVVLKMTRDNPTFQVRGYVFTKKHPFALVKEDDVDFIMARHTGFRPATPTEVREYYG